MSVGSDMAALQSVEFLEGDECGGHVIVAGAGRWGSKDVVEICQESLEKVGA